MKREPLKEWGVQHSPDIPYSIEWYCKNCNWQFESKTASNAIVGFSFYEPIPSRWSRAGTIIVQCPDCYERFWFHVTESNARWCMVCCDAWPKDEEAQYMASIKKLNPRT